MRNAVKLMIVLMLALALCAVLAGCEALEPYDGPTVNDPEPLDTGSQYPGGTYNEISLVFIEEMFADDMVSVSNREGGEYTISSELNKDVYGNDCDNYLAEDVIESVPDDWQVETWNLLIDNVSFQSVQPYVIFVDSSGNRWIKFWLDSNFAAVLNQSGGMTFEVSDEVIETVKAQFDELPARKSERRTPEMTVELFFEYMNAKNADGVNSLLATPLEEVHFTDGSSSEIESLLNLGHIGDFPAQWYENPYSNRVMYVKFKRADAEGARSLIWDIYLVRESAGAEWKIAAYGGA